VVSVLGLSGPPTSSVTGRDANSEDGIRVVGEGLGAAGEETRSRSDSESEVGVTAVLLLMLLLAEVVRDIGDEASRWVARARTDEGGASI
jgi:hypothetical protein